MKKILIKHVKHTEIVKIDEEEKKPSFLDYEAPGGVSHVGTVRRVKPDVKYDPCCGAFIAFKPDNPSARLNRPGHATIRKGDVYGEEC